MTEQHSPGQSVQGSVGVLTAPARPCLSSPLPVFTAALPAVRSLVHRGKGLLLPISIPEASPLPGSLSFADSQIIRIVIAESVADEVGSEGEQCPEGAAFSDLVPVSSHLPLH